MTKRITFQEPVVHLVPTQYGPPVESRPYGVRRHPSKPVNIEERDSRYGHVTRAIEKSAHHNATRLYEHSTSESVLIILGKLKKHSPRIWTETGRAASTEDDICKLCSNLDIPPPPEACGVWQIDELASKLGVVL